MEICQICGKKFQSKQGLGSHQGWHINSDRKSNFIKYNQNRKNMGLSGHNQFTKAKKEGQIIIISEETREKFREGGKNQEWDKKRREKHSKSMKKAIQQNPESYSASNVCGRTKLIEYNGFKLNGKWELEVAKWLDQQNIKWTNRIQKGFEYKWEDKKRLYFPDFYLIKEDLYIEVKGYQRDQDLAKWKSIPNLLILKKNEIEKIRNNTFGPLAQR